MYLRCRCRRSDLAQFTSAYTQSDSSILLKSRKLIMYGVIALWPSGNNKSWIIVSAIIFILVYNCSNPMQKINIQVIKLKLSKSLTAVCPRCEILATQRRKNKSCGLLKRSSHSNYCAFFVVPVALFSLRRLMASGEYSVSSK